MLKKKKNRKKSSRSMLSAYSIIMLLTILLGAISHLLPNAQFAPIVAEEAPVTEGTAIENETKVDNNGEISETIAEEQTTTNEQSSDATTDLPVTGVDVEIKDGEITETPDLTTETTPEETTYSSLEVC